MVDKRPIGYVPGKGNPLDKKPQRTHKYDYVSGTLKTGPTIKDINIMSDQAVAKRKGELFKRIRTSTLKNLLQITKQNIFIQQQEMNFESIYQLGEENHNQSIQENVSIISQPQSILSQATHVSAITYATENLGINNNTCFLLLDLREPEDFTMYHIRESINFPAPNVSRDKFIPAIYRFKNQTDKLIIIYHSDERNGTPFAQKFAEKGFDNVFLLSGGIEGFMKDYHEDLEGIKIPDIQKQEENKSRISMAKSQISQISKGSKVNKTEISKSNKDNLLRKSEIIGSHQTSVENTPKSVISSQIQHKGCEFHKYNNKSVHQSQSDSSNIAPQQKIAKRSNFREYPETGDVLIKSDQQGDELVKSIINNSAIKQSQIQMSPGLVNDSVFSNNVSTLKK